MNIKKIALLLVSHTLVALIGFAGGIYALPILTAPPAPSATAISQIHGTTESAKISTTNETNTSQPVQFSGTFTRELADSDGLHWGEGTVSIGSGHITLLGELAPGPDYRLYLSPQFVETEADFKRLKSTMVPVGDVKTFNNFIVALPDGVQPANFNTVIVWCESFGEFITAAQYRQ